MCEAVTPWFSNHGAALSQVEVRSRKELRKRMPSILLPVSATSPRTWISAAESC
jgi:hypothetical protein